MRQVQLCWPDEDANSAVGPPEQPTQSPPRKRTLNSTHDSYIDSSSTNVPVARQSAAAVVNAYIDELPVLTTQVRTVDKNHYWHDIVFRADVRYSKLHPLMERLMCVPATSAPVERV